MSNSSFQKNNSIPVPVSEGGIGVSSVPYGGVLIGAGSGSINTVSPGTAGNVLKSDGTNWTSVASSISDGSVTYSKLALDFTSIIDLASSNNIDWSLGGIYIKTLTSNTTLTFSNYKLNKSIILKVTGNYSLSLPNSIRKINGTYDGNFMNYIYFHCTNSTTPQEVWATINQRAVADYGYGYFAGGSVANPVSTTDRIVFSTGATSANAVSNLSQARQALVGLSDSSIYGYFAGGLTATYVSTTDRIVFSTGVTSLNTVSNISQARWGLSGLSDSSSYGYFAGGWTNTYVSTADRIVFSTGVTSANTVSILSQARHSLAGLSDSSSYGYFAGGISSTYVSTTDRVVFSTGITSLNTVSNLSQARKTITGLSDSSTYGYFAGGDTNTSVSTADRIVFSTGVTSVNTVSNLSQARGGTAGLSDSSTYGYFTGGTTNNGTNYVSTADRIVFSTGVTSANTVSNLSQARGYLPGLSSCGV